MITLCNTLTRGGRKKRVSSFVQTMAQTNLLLTLTWTDDFVAGVMKSVYDNLSSDDAYVYEVLINYFE